MARTGTHEHADDIPADLIANGLEIVCRLTFVRERRGVKFQRSFCFGIHGTRFDALDTTANKLTGFFHT
jgi:hypothetical protein